MSIKHLLLSIINFILFIVIGCVLIVIGISVVSILWLILNGIVDGFVVIYKGDL